MPRTHRHSFLRRLHAGLAVLVVAVLAGLAVFAFSERSTSEAFARSHTALGLLDDFKEVEIRLAEARAAEREFLLEDLRAPAFFQTGVSPSLERHARARESLTSVLDGLIQQPAARELGAQAIRSAIADYMRDFDLLVARYRERGSLYTGALGGMREAAFDFQDLLDGEEEAAGAVLRIELLALQGDLDQYLRDLDNRPSFTVGERLVVLGEEIDRLGPTSAAELRAALGRFAAGWAQLQALDDAIGRSSGTGLRGQLHAAEGAVVPLTLGAVERARANFEQARVEAAMSAATARFWFAGFACAAAGVALVLGFSLGGLLRLSLARVLEAVEAYAAGDRTARVGAMPRDDEFAVVGSAFDRLAESLQETTEELEEVNASLKLAVKGDTAGLMDRIQALIAERRA